MKAPKAVREERELKSVGEGHRPFIGPDIIGAERHYARIHCYIFASKFVSGKRVLDLASGEGYGSFIFSREAESVVGIEIDPQAIVRAENKYAMKNIKFIQGSILDIPIEEEESFDVIVCFEVNEQIADQNKLFSEVKRLLKDEGLFIVSTPIKQSNTVDPNYCNPFHLKEFYFKEFEGLLRNYFTNMCFLEQRVYMDSSIWPLPEGASLYEDLPLGIGNEVFQFKYLIGKIPLNIIAIASNSSKDIKIIKGHLIEGSNAPLNHRDKQISTLAVRADILEQCIFERDRRINDLEDLLRSSNERVHELKCRIDDMQSGVLWQLLMKYQLGFVDRALPHGTGRREKYDLALKAGRTLFNEGWCGFYKSLINPPSTQGGFNSEHSINEAYSFEERVEQSEEEMLVHRQEVPLEIITIETYIGLKKGNNLIIFHIPEGGEKPCDIPEMKSEDGRRLGLEIRDLSIMDGIVELPINWGGNWHRIEESDESTLRWLSNDATVNVDSIADCSAKLVLKAHSFYRPRKLEIYTKEVQTRYDSKEHENRRFILLRKAEIKADRDAVKSELENILNRVKDELSDHEETSIDNHS